MDMLAVRDGLAKSLAELVDIPFLSEGAEQDFFAGLLSQVWDRLPHKVRAAISSTAEYLPQDRVEHYTAAVMRAIGPTLKRMLFWRTNNEDMTQAVTQAIMLMAAQGQSVQLTSSPAPADPATADA